MKRYRSPGAFVAGAALLAAAACAPSIRSERDAAIPVPHGATWAWEGQGSLPDTGRYIRQDHAVTGDPIVQQRFRRAIEAVMDEKGFRRVDTAAQPDFVLSYAFGGPDDGYAHRRVAGGAAISVGYVGGWGYGRGFYPGWGLYRPWRIAPWGWWGPGWGWGFYSVPAWGFAVAPSYAPYHAYGGYGETGLVLTLRLRSSGEVAFEGRYHTSAYEARRMSQERVQEIVTKMLKDLP